MSLNIAFQSVRNLFGLNEWIGEGVLTMSVLEKPATIWVKLKTFITGEMASETKADIIGDPIQATYTLDPKEKDVIQLNSTLIGSIEGKMIVEDQFFGIEYGNEVLGYAGFEAFHFSSQEKFSYEGKFINCIGETCDIEAKFEVHG